MSSSPRSRSSWALLRPWVFTVRSSAGPAKRRFTTAVPSHARVFELGADRSGYGLDRHVVHVERGGRQSQLVRKRKVADVPLSEIGIVGDDARALVDQRSVLIERD